AGGVFEQFLDIGTRDPRALAVGANEGGFGIDVHALWIERRQKGLHLVVTERPEELGRHDGGSRRRVGVIRRVELQEPRFTVGVSRRAPRVTTRGRLPPDDARGWIWWGPG